MWERRGRQAEVEPAEGLVWGCLLRGRRKGPSLGRSHRAFWRATSLAGLLVYETESGEWQEQTIVRFL